MEIWDIYDENRVKKGKTVLRGSKIVKGDYHLVVHVAIINNDNKMLIQHRQPFKEGFSNLWDITCGGSAIVGENTQDAAHRELLEEIGLSMDFSKSRPYFTINFNQGFDDYFIVRAEVELSQLKLQEEEVQDVRWANEKEILEMIDKEEFVPYHNNLISLMFEIYKYNGSIREYIEIKGEKDEYL